MAMNEAALQARARRAYEWGRLRWSLRLVPLVALAAGAAAACGRPAGLCCALGAAVAGLAVGLSWAGGSGGRAVAPGLIAGVCALALPLAMRTVGHFCESDVCMTLCLPACVVGGGLAGVLLALRAVREEQGALFAVSGLALAGLMGALGCTLSGAAGVAGMLAGAIIAGGPVLAVAARRA